MGPVKELLESPEVRRGQELTLHRDLGGTQLCNPLTSDFWPPDPENKFLTFTPPSLW